MGNVYIKDMVMPQCCSNCNMYISNLMCIKHYCTLSSECADKTFNPAEERMKHCKLVEVDN